MIASFLIGFIIVKMSTSNSLSEFQIGSTCPHYSSQINLDIKKVMLKNQALINC